MKLLFDENLSIRLCSTLSDLFPGSAHVHSLGLSSASDDEVWSTARIGDYVIVSKDSDFHQRSFLYGAPPKVIWIRTGNCSTRDIAEILRLHAEAITSFALRDDATFLELG